MTDAEYAIYREILPRSLLDIAEVAGIATVVALVRRYRGTEIYIPQEDWVRKQSAETWELLELLGLDACCALARSYGPGRLKIAKGEAAVRLARNVAITHAHFVQHIPYSQLAGQYGLDVRSIITICTTTPLQGAKNPQMDLFA